MNNLNNILKISRRTIDIYVIHPFIVKILRMFNIAFFKNIFVDIILSIIIIEFIVFVVEHILRKIKIYRISVGDV